MKRIGLTLMAVLAFAASSAHATDIKEVVSPGGIHAWLVEDHKLPLIAMQFAFRGGVEQDPADKQGLATMTMGMLSEGAGPYDDRAFQQQLADHSISLKFGAGRDAVDGSLKMLRDEKKTGFDLLHLALTSPKMDEVVFKRMQAQHLAALRGQLSNPDWQARYALYQYIFAGHPYGQRSLGSTATLSSLTSGDVKNFAAEHLARDNLVVAVAGDMTEGELAAVLDKVFGALPEHAHLTAMDDFTWPASNAVIAVPREGTQTDVLFAMPGPKLGDKDWYACQIANYILGGGGFSSRLMQEVRDKKGLTYGIDTGLSAMDHGGMIAGDMASDNPKVAEAWDITQNTLKHFYNDGVTEAEVAAAKDFLTGSLPLAMTSTDKIAAVLADLQLEHRARDYLDRRNDLLRQVSVDQVNDAIRHWFNPDKLNVSMVGKPEHIVPTQTRELTRQ